MASRGQLHATVTMSFKRKRSNSIVDLTINALPLPPPLTTRPLNARSDSPASSSSGSRRVKRPRPSDLIVDVDALPESNQPIAGPSRLSREVIDVEAQANLWQEVDCHDSYDQVELANPIKAKNAAHGRNAVAGPSKYHSTSTDPQLTPSPGASSPPPPSNLLSTHTCPICFSTVTNACLTPCGHVLCGACLFAAVKSGIKRALEMAVPIGGDGTAARYVTKIDIGMKNMKAVIIDALYAELC